MEIALLFILCAVVFTLLVLIFLPLFLRPSVEAERMFSLVRSNRQDLRTVTLTERFWTFVTRQGSRLRNLGLGDATKLKRRLVQAGMRGSHTPDVYIATQVVLALAGALLGSLSPVNPFFWIFAGGVVAFMAPDFWLTSRGNKRRERIRRSLPDTVDLLGICVNAGLGLDQAFQRVGQELSLSHPEINQEFRIVDLERRAGTPRIDAWTACARRNNIEELTTFVAMLAETDRFGTPILQALTSFSGELRVKRRQRAEEAAAQTKIKIIFPLVLCIFPCIFIVLLAPAILSILDNMRTVGH